MPLLVLSPITAPISVHGMKVVQVRACILLLLFFFIFNIFIVKMGI